MDLTRVFEGCWKRTALIPWDTAVCSGSVPRLLQPWPGIPPAALGRWTTMTMTGRWVARASPGGAQQDALPLRCGAFL